MKKFAALSVSAGVLTALITTSAVSAWSFNLTGNGACVPNGVYNITWTLDNTSEPEAMTVIESSSDTVVPVGTVVPAGQTSSFTQTVNGTAAASHDLTVKAKWPSDQNPQTRTSTVTLDEACPQPTGGRGAGPVEPVVPVATTPTAPQPAQVTVPVGAVDAGSGNNANIAAFSAGILGSAALIVAAIRRFVRQ